MRKSNIDLFEFSFARERFALPTFNLVSGGNFCFILIFTSGIFCSVIFAEGCE